MLQGFGWHKQCMHGRWEVGDAEWELLEPILRPARRADHRGRPWHDTRAVLNGVLWVLGTGAQWRELPSKYPPFQTCHRRFQQWVRTGKLERALRRLAQHLHAEGKLDLREAFIDASFSSAKKGALPSGRPSVGRARRSSLSPLVTVFLSPYLCKALRRTNPNWSKKSWGKAFSMNSPSTSSATRRTTRTGSTNASGKSTESS